MSWRRLVLQRAGLNPLLGGLVLFGLSCGRDSTGPSTDPSAPGTLRIAVTTTGSFIDPDGYAFSVDGIGSDPPWTVVGSGVLEITGITPGYHTVQLAGVEINCVVENGDSRTLEIPAGEVQRIEYHVSCVTPEHFSILVIGTTSVGPGSDPDGYSVQIDDGEWQPLGIGEALTVPGLAPGVHSVLLAGLASHCDVVFGDNPVNVTIGAAYMAGAGFTVYCGHPGGSVEVTTVTTGSSPDPDGYLLSIDGISRPIGSNATVLVEDLSPSSHVVGLTDFTANCQVDGENPRHTAVLGYGGRAQVTFNITCSGL
jgi:hypothetical protein